MLTLIAIPTNFVASTSAIISDVFTDFSGPIYLILGVILAAVLLEIIIGAIRPK